MKESQPRNLRPTAISVDARGAQCELVRATCAIASSRSTENAANPLEERRTEIQRWEEMADSYVAETPAAETSSGALAKTRGLTRDGADKSPETAKRRLPKALVVLWDLPRV